VLYVHSGWAIENVGLLWFGNVSRAKVTFIAAADPGLTADLAAQHDVVWYGYSSLYNVAPCNPSKAVVVVHDPTELFPERPDWRNFGFADPACVARLAAVRKVVTASVEMERVLQSAGLSPARIPTASRIPLRAESALEVDAPRSFLSVGRIYRRKNFEQFQRVARALRPSGIHSRLKSDHFPLSEEAYIRLLDDHPVYLCTSFQEGGPLPIMDAMHRGAVVLSTPSGQAPELVEHGKNGFLCSTDQEFLDALEELFHDPARLRRLRVESLRSIRRTRGRAVIGKAVDLLLQELFPGCSLDTASSTDDTRPSAA